MTPARMDALFRRLEADLAEASAILQEMECALATIESWALTEP